jgi:hypothetical protein
MHEHSRMQAGSGPSWPDSRLAGGNAGGVARSGGTQDDDVATRWGSRARGEQRASSSGGDTAQDETCLLVGTSGGYFQVGWLLLAGAVSCGCLQMIENLWLLLVYSALVVLARWACLLWGSSGTCLQAGGLLVACLGARAHACYLDQHYGIRMAIVLTHHLLHMADFHAVHVLLCDALFAAA